MRQEAESRIRAGHALTPRRHGLALLLSQTLQAGCPPAPGPEGPSAQALASGMNGSRPPTCPLKNPLPPEPVPTQRLSTLKPGPGAHVGKRTTRVTLQLASLPHITG